MLLALGCETQNSAKSEQPAPAVRSEATELPSYEVVGRKPLNNAEIIEVKTTAPVNRLKSIADRQGLPRYRVEKSQSGIRVDDMTEQRRIAGLRIE
jgi:hypothetical protein